MTQVKNKSWFGVLNVLSLMVKDWAILREASSAILSESGGVAAGMSSEIDLQLEIHLGILNISY